MGASAGGVMALIEFAKSLPDDLNASIFVVQHVAPSTPSVLPQIVARSGPFSASHASDGEEIKPRHFYIAPPDHHLLIEGDRVLVKRGPKENRFRPSIDALFRSAAYEHGSRVIGIVLSGLLDDGTSGLWTIQRMGGISIIQDPHDAEFPNMPRSVLEYVDVDHMVPVAYMGPLLAELVRQEVNGKPLLSQEELKRLEVEINIASQKNAFEMGIHNMGDPSLLTCPECSGALVELKEGRLTRYRCHTGHAFIASSLLADVTKSVEENIWKAVRGLEEAFMLLEREARECEETGNKKEAALLLARAAEYREKGRQLHKIANEHKQVSGVVNAHDRSGR